jgi:catechol 2,3-dioxygenase-like lactoylglutathione lyase family enzyme
LPASSPPAFVCNRSCILSPSAGDVYAFDNAFSSFAACSRLVGGAQQDELEFVCFGLTYEGRSHMLAGKDAAATLAVSDLQRARDFYENTLGLEAVQEPPGAILYRSGNSVVLVYPSEYAGTNKATAASWAVGDDFDSIVMALQEKGVTFEHYDDLPETSCEGDIHRMGDFKAVWFKDPDGNILNLINESM